MCQDFVQNIRLAGVIPEINSSYVVVFAQDCQAVPKRRLNWVVYSISNSTLILRDDSTGLPSN